MAADGASSISVTVRVRPFTIREAAQLAKCDDQTLFLGDGSLASAPTPKLHQKGLRPVLKVVDEKCLYAFNRSVFIDRANKISEYSILQKIILCSGSQDQLYRRVSG